MKITLKIQRFNPAKDQKPFFMEYGVTVKPTDRILDAIIDIKRNQDGSLAFRRSCAHGVCGSDAMIINNKEALACKTLVQDAAADDGDVITLQPLNHQEIQRDLMVDQSTFFQKYRDVQPFFIPRDEDLKGEQEQFQSVEEREFFDDSTKCILCSACYSACPVLDKNPDFIGPAAIVQAVRFVNDSRDKGLEPRLAVLDSPNGVWPCENNFHCTEVCPREIPVTKLINLTKRQIKAYRKERGEEIHDDGQDAMQKAAKKADRQAKKAAK
ncbi:MAG: succinate dehydrogenase/fumarate reductase iron-sulfur subunit [Salinispira sp.]